MQFTVITWVLTHAVLFLGGQQGLFLLQNTSGQKLDKTILAVCMFHVCIFFEGPKITYNCRLSRRLWFLLWCFTLSFSHFKFNNTLKQQTWQFSSSRQLCNLILLFSSQRYVTWNSWFLQNTRKMSLFWGINERKLNIWRRNGRETILFFLKT